MRTTRNLHTQRDWTYFLLRFWSVAVFLFLFLPIIAIVVSSFNGGRSLEVWDHFSLNPFHAALSDQAVRSVIRTSLIAAIGSSLLSTVLGSLAGIALARRPGRWSPSFLGLLALILVTPEIITAIALLIWFVRLRSAFPILDNGLVRLWIGHSLFSTAVVALIVRARMSGVDETLEEAAADLYATPARRFLQITLPMMMPAVISGLLLAFSLSLDDTIISTFVNVAGTTPWPVFVFSAVRSVLRPEIAAVSTLMLGVTMIAVFTVFMVLRQSGDSTLTVTKTLAGQ